MVYLKNLKRNHKQLYRVNTDLHTFRLPLLQTLLTAKLSRMVIPNTHLTYRMSHLTFITKTCTKYTGTSTNHSYQLSRKHVPSTHLTFHRPLFIFTTKTCTEYTSVTFNLYHENMYQVHRTIYESAIIYHENMYQVHRTIYKS